MSTDSGRAGAVRMHHVGLFTAALALMTAAHAGGDAEYAVRWDPSAGGPATIDAVLNLLGSPGGKTREVAVQYFSVQQPAELPTGFAAIARERTSDGAKEATYKERGATPFPASARKWNCPLAGPAASKNEVDVLVLSDASVRKAYSRSCSADDSIASSLPSRFHAQPLGCSSNVARVHARDIKVELWNLPGGRQALEVSWVAKDAEKDLRAFRARVLRILVGNGVKPLTDSKTELGSTC